MTWPFGKSRMVTNDGMRPQYSHPSSPQYLPGVEPAGSAKQDGFRVPYSTPGNDANTSYFVKPSHPAVVTPGFADGETPQAQLNYGLRPQPDVGGALNYAYENYDLPLQQPAGAFVVARSPFQPIGGTPLQAWPISVPSSVGGLIPGQMISQPLLNPLGPDNGYDIYN